MSTIGQLQTGQHETPDERFQRRMREVEEDRKRGIRKAIAIGCGVVVGAIAVLVGLAYALTAAIRAGWGW